MRAVVHIGTEKTGTTTIQEFLDRNRVALAGRGYHLLESAGRPSHRWLPSYCMAEDREDDFLAPRGGADPVTRRNLKARFRRRLDAEMAGLGPDVHSVLISSEHLHSRLVRRPEISAFGDLLSEYVDEVEVVVYLRDQVDLCLSLYSTAIRQGWTETLEEFVRTCTPQNVYYDYARLLGLWRDRFGREALDVGIFEPERLRGDLLDDFVGRWAPDLVGGLDKDVPRANESLSPTGQALGRAVNRALGGRSERLRVAALDRIGRRFTGKADRLDPVVRRALRAAFAETNESVRQEWFPGQETLFRTHA